jgi:hypothetical protein
MEWELEEELTEGKMRGSRARNAVQNDVKGSGRRLDEMRSYGFDEASPVSQSQLLFC